MGVSIRMGKILEFSRQFLSADVSVSELSWQFVYTNK